MTFGQQHVRPKAEQHTPEVAHNLDTYIISHDLTCAARLCTLLMTGDHHCARFLNILQETS